MLVLESLLRDHGSDASPQEELLRLLGSGSMSPAMNQFLSSTLGGPSDSMEPASSGAFPLPSAREPSLFRATMPSGAR